jgi:hypothetical protein
MSFIDKFFHRPPPSPEPLSRGSKGQFIPSRKERVRRTREVEIRLELEMLKIHLPPDQFRAAVERGSTR